jgi:hypothetical protein
MLKMGDGSLAKQTFDNLLYIDALSVITPLNFTLCETFEEHTFAEYGESGAA